MRYRHILALAFGVIPLTLLAAAVDEKGFVFTTGAAARLRAEPKADAKETAAPPFGGRLLYRKVVRDGDAVGWYFVEQAGVGTGWLSATEASDKRATATPAAKPVKRSAPPVATSGTAPQGAAARGLSAKLATSASAQTAGSRTLAERAAKAQGKPPAEGDRLLRETTIDFVTLERVIGYHMSDPPHPDGRYADVTARGRKEDDEKFAKSLAEGD